MSRFTTSRKSISERYCPARLRLLPVAKPPPVISRDSLLVILASWFAIGTVLALLWSVG
jgi:hypothetical protein